MWVGEDEREGTGRGVRVSNLFRRGKLVGSLVGLLRKKVCQTGSTKTGMSNFKP